MAVVFYILVSEACWKRRMVHNKHQNHQTLWQNSVRDAGHSHELDHAVLRIVVHVPAAENATQVENDIEAWCESEPGPETFYPLSVASIRDRPAIGVQEEDLKTVQHDQLAIVAPGAQKENVDH